MDILILMAIFLASVFGLLAIYTAAIVPPDDF